MPRRRKGSKYVDLASPRTSFQSMCLPVFLQYLIQVRNDLERVRMLAELVRKREQEKLRQARIIKQFVEQSIFPFDAAIRAAFNKIVQYVCWLTSSCPTR